MRDHSFHLDSPGQSMSLKEQMFLMFYILSVKMCARSWVSRTGKTSTFTPGFTSEIWFV